MIKEPLVTKKSFNPPMPIADISEIGYLTLNSILADLPTHDFQTDMYTFGQQVAYQLKMRPELPGVIVMNGSSVEAVFSRQKFLEQLGRPFGIEVYMNRPIARIIEVMQANPLLIPSIQGIHQAARAALRRPAQTLYEPIVVDFGNGRYRLLDVYVLLRAQSHLLSLVYEIEQERRQLAESFQKIGKALSGSLSLPKVTRRILKELQKVVPYERGTVMLREGMRLRSIYHRGFPKDTLPEDVNIAIRPDDEDIFQRIIRHKKPIIVPDVTRDIGWQQLSWLSVHKSWLGVPLIVQNRVTGMISLTRIPTDAFHRGEVDLVKTFAGQAATALENARLYEQVQQFNTELEERVDERTSELNRAYSALEQLDRSKTDFIEVSAHELRTPLTIIKGNVQLLGMYKVINEDNDLHTILAGILTGTDRLHRVVNSMLDVAKIDSDTLKVFREGVIIKQLINYIIDKFKPDLEERRISVTTSGLTELPTINGDGELLRKVFYSVIVNAIKYTPDGGEITVTAMVIFRNNQPLIELVVSDTGIGIDVEQQSLIFQKFYQTGKSALHSSGETKFKGGGPGLGLAIAQGIVRAHNGDIWVESDGHDEEKCPGSQFHICLPVNQ